MVDDPSKHAEAQAPGPRVWLFVLLMGILIALAAGAIVVIRPDLPAGLLGTSSPAPSLSSEESSWCARNRDDVFAAVVETDEIGPLVVPGEAELWEFWTTDEWITMPRDTWSDRERNSYDRMCRTAIRAS